MTGVPFTMAIDRSQVYSGIYSIHFDLGSNRPNRYIEFNWFSIKFILILFNPFFIVYKIEEIFNSEVNDFIFLERVVTFFA